VPAAALTMLVWGLKVSDCDYLDCSAIETRVYSRFMADCYFVER
jgi:hypothetical protein